MKIKRIYRNQWKKRSIIKTALDKAANSIK